MSNKDKYYTSLTRFIYCGIQKLENLADSRQPHTGEGEGDKGFNTRGVKFDRARMYIRGRGQQGGNIAHALEYPFAQNRECCLDSTSQLYTPSHHSPDILHTTLRRTILYK